MNTVVSSKLSGKLVSKTHVVDLIRNYKRQRWLLNSKTIGKEDSLSASFGINELSDFIFKAREHKASGIKICFGVYPENYAINPEYSGRQTVVLIAIKEKQQSDGKILLKDIYYNNNGHAEILAFNLSTLCPPDCGIWPNDGENDLGTILFQNGKNWMVG